MDSSSLYRDCAFGLLLFAVGGPAVALQVGGPQLVSHTPSGLPTSGICYSPVLSDRGHFTVFTCQSGDVIAGEPGTGDLMRWDATSGGIVAIGLTENGSWPDCGAAELGTCTSVGVAASDSGAYVVLNSGAQLTPDAPPLGAAGNPNVFLRNVTAAATVLLTPEYNPYALPAASDADVERSEILFSTRVNFLGGPDTNGSSQDLYVKNWKTGAIELISTTDGTTQGDAYSSTGVFSPDGRYAAFVSAADFGGQNPQHFQNLFLRDRTARTTRRLTFPLGGGEFTASPYFMPTLRMTADNNHVLFSAFGAHFAAGDDPARQNIYLLEISAGTTHLLPLTNDGGTPNGASYGRADISADGNHLVFVSAATNLTSIAAAVPAVFVQDLQSGEAVSVSAPLGALVLPLGTSAPQVAISKDGTRVAFDWPAYNAKYPTHLDSQQVYTATIAARSQSAVTSVPAMSFPNLLILAALLLIAASSPLLQSAFRTLQARHE